MFFMTMQDKQTLPSTLELVNHPNNISNNENRLEDNHHNSTKQPDHRRMSAAVLTINDGLTCTACLMIGVGALSLDHMNVTMILTGVAGIIMGACCMAIGEFVSRNKQLDFEACDDEEAEEVLSNDPLVAAAATAVAFSVGAVIPLLVVVLLQECKLGLGVVEGATSTFLAMVGWLGPFLARAPALRAALRVLLCGWVAMTTTFGFMVVMIAK